MLIVFFSGEISATDVSRRVIRLRKELPLPSQLISANCTYEVSFNFDLGGDTIHLPKNIVLHFKDGMFSNGLIFGDNTLIDSDCTCVFKDVQVLGEWRNEIYYPEWFGAAGDGETDDTESIKKTIWLAKAKKVVFGSKTYIINIMPSYSNNTQRIIFPDCKCSELIGRNTIIKLGNNDNCNLYKSKGFGALFSVYTIDSFHAKGITFDFNYEKNPIFQTQGTRQDIQENTQQNAFQFRRVRKVMIDDCKFIGHSGTNCIDYNDAKYNVGDKVFEVTIENCRFLQSGGKSFYISNNSTLDAYHDCSTIAIHYSGSNHDTPLVVKVNNNYFEGVGGNAYNVIETDGSNIEFSGNVITKYVSGIFICSAIYDGVANVVNNKFSDVSRAIVLWLRGGSDADSYRYGFRNMNISRNVCTVNMGYWIPRQRYDNIGKKVSNRYGFIFTTSGNNKSVKNLSVVENTVEYINYDCASPNVCVKAAINFETAGDSVSMMRCNILTIKNNVLYNAVNRILHNSMFQEINTLLFDSNIIINPFSVEKASAKDGGGVIYLNHSRAYAPSLTYPVVNNFIATNNIINYEGYHLNDGCAAIVNSQIRGKKGLVGSSLIARNNICKTTPQYGAVRFEHQDEIFEKIIIEELYNESR